MKTVKQLMDLSGRVALITGGAGHIGAAMAEALAELGCGVHLVDRDAESLDRLATRLADTWGSPVWTYVADLEDESARLAVVEDARSRCGRLDILVNNAAFVGDSKLKGWVTRFEDQGLEAWRRALEVNLTATFHLSQACAGLLQASGHGSIVNIASIYGVVGPDLGLYAGTQMGNPAAYAASKGGMVQLTRWLATVMAPGVRVNCISPGGVARGQPEVFVERYVARTPLARMAVEEDFKGALAFLASDLSAYVTGQNLMVDGGWTTW